MKQNSLTVPAPQSVDFKQNMEVLMLDSQSI